MCSDGSMNEPSAAQTTNKSHSALVPRPSCNCRLSSALLLLLFSPPITVDCADVHYLNETSPRHSIIDKQQRRIWSKITPPTRIILLNLQYNRFVALQRCIESMKMLPCSGQVRYFAPTDIRYVKAPKLRRGTHDNFSSVIIGRYRPTTVAGGGLRW